uniref:Uncharacterized protein n=1 Tax=Arundo donax TaxID=35708 RepID=A0A0A8ZTF8_ARUDO
MDICLSLLPNYLINVSVLLLIVNTKRHVVSVHSLSRKGKKKNSSKKLQEKMNHGLGQ